MRRRSGTRPLGMLLGALLGIAVVGLFLNPGFRPFRRGVEQAKGLKSGDCLAQLGKGLEDYRADHGAWPEAPSFAALVEGTGPLAREGRIPALPLSDPWGRPYRGRSTPTGYRLEAPASPLSGAGAFPGLVLTGGIPPAVGP